MSSLSKSNFAVSSYPMIAAHASGGVRPYLVSRMLGLISPRCKSNFATRSCPLVAAQPSAVRPWKFSLVLGVTSSRSKKHSAIPSCPLIAAHISGVWPYLVSGMLGSIPSCSNKSSVPNRPVRPALGTAGLTQAFSETAGPDYGKPAFQKKSRARPG